MQWYLSKNDAEPDNTKDLDVVMAMYNLIEYSNSYAKASENLSQYHKDVSSNQWHKLWIIYIQGKNNRKNSCW